MFENGIVSLFKEQRDSFRKSTRRMNIWDGPVRSGKTASSTVRWIEEIGRGPEGDMVMVGKTNGSLYRNIIRPMERLLGPEMYYHQENDGRVIDIWDRKIHCVGANDERAEAKIRGATFAGAYGDEITLWPQSFFSQLMFRLSAPGSKLIGTTNPDNPNHFLKKDYLDRIGELDIARFSWPIDANIHLPKEYVEAIKKEYVGLWYRRYILGEWCVAEGAVYDFFDEALHTQTWAPDPQYYVVSIDYGIGNPTSMGLYGVNMRTHPKAWRIKGYWWDSRKEGRQKTDADYSRDLKTFLGDIVPRAVIVDPSAASLKLQIRRDHKNYLVQDAKNEVLSGIQTQAKMLQSGDYVIMAGPQNKACVDEYYGYLWDSKAALRGEDKPVKTSDHTKDEERYFLETTFEGMRANYKSLTTR